MVGGGFLEIFIVAIVLFDIPGLLWAVFLIGSSGMHSYLSSKDLVALSARFIHIKRHDGYIFICLYVAILVTPLHQL